MKRIGLVLAVTAPLACGGEPPPAEPEVRPVRTVTVEASVPEEVRILAGVVRAGVESRLSFRVGGTVEAVLVGLGDAVRRGQALARLDPIDTELRLEEAEAALAQQRASLRRAEADYERVRALYENNNASKAELDAGRANAESARALVAAVEKQVEQADRALGDTVLAAPLDGAIASVSIEVNENVQAGQQAFLLTSGDHPEVEVAVPEVLIQQVRPGQPVEVRVGALADRVLPASVSEVGVAAAGGSTFGVTVRCDGPETEVRSGMAADVTFRFSAAAAERIVVPGVAVGEDAQGHFVFVVETAEDGSSVARRRAVEVGELAEGIEIRDGLRAGDVLVTAGVRRLSDGQRVQAPPEGAG